MNVTGSAKDSIRQEILHCLRGIDPDNTDGEPKLYKMHFTVRWDIRTFLGKINKTAEEAVESLDESITLTGSESDAQAMTVSGYMCQTWPVSSPVLMKLLKGVVKSDDTVSETTAQTQLLASTVKDQFNLTVTGEAETIAEFGEQLAWLSAALRPSGSRSYNAGGPVFGVRPYVRKAGPRNSDTPESPPTFECNLDLRFDPLRLNTDVEVHGSWNGQPWPLMFMGSPSPRLVRDYPIPQRPKADMGLELTMEMMKRLMGINFSEPGRKLCIKGTRTMSIPLDSEDLPRNMIMWHLLVKQDDTQDPISWEDYDTCEVPVLDPNINDLIECRHFIGRCSKVNAGTE